MIVFSFFLLLFEGHQLHLHVPEGAVEKDGPSAGVAMTTSLISIATNKSLRPRLAMTGLLLYDIYPIIMYINSKCLHKRNLIR